MPSPEFTGQLMFGSKRSFEEVERALRAARSLLAWIDGEELCSGACAPHLDVAAMAVDGLRRARVRVANEVSDDDPS